MTPHPAKFSAPIIRELRWLVDMESINRSLRVLDPFAGVGGIHELATKRIRTVGVELEPEWANQHPNTRVGDALALPFRRNSFDIICTSPCYGNRMADNHNARDSSERNTYKHKLGRDPSPGSAAVLQWGEAYWAFHRLAWAHALEKLRSSGLFIINIKDHYRDRQIMPATEWHAGVLALLGLMLEQHVKVPVSGNRHGENGDARVPFESILVFRKP